MVKLLPNFFLNKRAALKKAIKDGEKVPGLVPEHFEFKPAEKRAADLRKREKMEARRRGAGGSSSSSNGSASVGRSDALQPGLAMSVGSPVAKFNTASFSPSPEPPQDDTAGWQPLEQVPSPREGVSAELRDRMAEAEAKVAADARQVAREAEKEAERDAATRRAKANAKAQADQAASIAAAAAAAAKAQKVKPPVAKKKPPTVAPRSDSLSNPRRAVATSTPVKSGANGKAAATRGGPVGGAGEAGSKGRLSPTSSLLASLSAVNTLIGEAGPASPSELPPPPPDLQFSPPGATPTGTQQFAFELPPPVEESFPPPPAVDIRHHLVNVPDTSAQPGSELCVCPRPLAVARAGWCGSWADRVDLRLLVAGIASRAMCPRCRDSWRSRRGLE